MSQPGEDDFEFDFGAPEEQATAHDAYLRPQGAALPNMTFLDLDAGAGAAPIASAPKFELESASPWADRMDALKLDVEGDLTRLGARYGPFEVTGFLGEGAMSVVVRAMHVETGEQVAIKILGEKLAGATAIRERFRREAMALSQLQHENIMRVHTYGIVRDRPFMVLELLDHGSVRDLLDERGALPVRRALEIATGVLAGLEASHAQGFLHRDIKPENLVLDATGRVKIVDFGLVRWVEDTENPLTMAGARLGTPLYMAPEQSGGRPVDARADVYSVGATLFELLTGQVPFSASNMIELAELQEGPPPSPRELRPEVSPELDRAVRRMMAPRPADRFASAAEARQALVAAMPQASEIELELRTPTEIHTVMLREGEQVVLGRSSKSADIAIPDKLLSRAHCALASSGTEVLLLDLGSTNGTFLASGQQVTEPTPLLSQDRFRIGDTELEVSWTAV